MTETVQAYPLQWPPGWPRAKLRSDAAFHHYGNRLELGHGINRVLQQLNTLGIPESKVVISSDLRLRMDGRPYADQPHAKLDPGVAVYWQEGKRQRCIAVDRYTRMPDNLAAIAATLDAMRAIKRHGGAEILDRAFTGFTALPAPEQWFQVLGVGAAATRAEIEGAYKRLAMQHHPDREGGSDQAMTRINTARDDGLAQASA